MGIQPDTLVPQVSFPLSARCFSNIDDTLEPGGRKPLERIGRSHNKTNGTRHGIGDAALGCRQRRAQVGAFPAGHHGLGVDIRAVHPASWLRAPAAWLVWLVK